MAPETEQILDLTDESKHPKEVALAELAAYLPEYEPTTEVYDPLKDREKARGDLARGLLWLLAIVIGGVHLRRPKFQSLSAR